MAGEVCHNCELGITVGEKVINMIRYADDKAIVTNTQKGLHELIDRLTSVTKEYGMKINVKKTEVVCISDCSA